MSLIQVHNRAVGAFLHGQFFAKGGGSRAFCVAPLKILPPSNHRGGK